MATRVRKKTPAAAIYTRTTDEAIRGAGRAFGMILDDRGTTVDEKIEILERLAEQLRAKTPPRMENPNAKTDTEAP